MPYSIDPKGAQLCRFPFPALARTLLRILAGAVLLVVSVLSCDANVEPAARVVELGVVSGDDQRSEVATPVPEDLVVVAVDPGGEPVAGVEVSWTTEPGAVELLTTKTDGEGRARARWTLGSVAGRQHVEARVGDVAATFAAEAEPGPAAGITLRPDTIELRALGDTAAFAVEVNDAHGNPRSNDLVRWRVVDSTVAAVLQGGAVALRNGATSVLAAEGEVADTAWLVVRQVAARVGIEPRGLAVDGDGEGARFSFVVEDGNGTPMDQQPQQVRWTTLNPAVATVDGSGTPTATGIGQAVIQAESGGAVGYALVTAAVPQAVAPEWRVEDSGATEISDLWVGKEGVGWAVTPLGLLRGEAGEWTYENAGQGFRPLMAVSGSAPDNVMAVGAGRSLRYDGATWTQIQHPADTLVSVWVGSSSAVYAVDCEGRTPYDPGNKARLMRLVGSTWAPIAEIPTDACPGIWGASAETLFAVTPDALYRYEPESFIKVVDSPGTLRSSVSGTGSGEVIAGGYVVLEWDLPHALLVRYGGETVTVDTVIGAGIVEKTWGVPDESGRLFASTSAGSSDGPSLYEHTDSGWIGVEVPGGTVGTALAGRSADEVYVGDYNGGVHRFDGAGFSTEREGGDRLISALWGMAIDQLWAGGSRIPDGRAVVSRYDGSRWHDEFVGEPNVRVSDLWGSSPTELWAVSGNSIVHYNGDGWSSETTNVQLNTIWGAGPDAVFAGGADGVILHYDGSSWRRMPGVPTEFAITELWGWAEDDLYATTWRLDGSDGQLLHYNGSSWSVADPLGNADGLHGTAAGDLFVASGPNVFRYRDGHRYSYPLPPDPVRTNTWMIWKLWATGTDDLYAMGSDGILRFDGEAWHVVGPGPVTWGEALWGLPGGDVLGASWWGAIFHGVR